MYVYDDQVGILPPVHCPYTISQITEITIRAYRMRHTIEEESSEDNWGKVPTCGTEEGEGESEGEWGDSSDEDEDDAV